MPGRARHVMTLVRQMRGGKDYDASLEYADAGHRALCRDDGAPLPHDSKTAGPNQPQPPLRHS